MSDSWTTEDESSTGRVRFPLLTETTSYDKNSLIAVLSWYFGKLSLVVGIATLGVATAILALFGRRSDNRGGHLSVSLMTLVLGAMTVLFFHRTRIEPVHYKRVSY